MQQKLVFTALPAGLDSNSQMLKLSVLISPQVPQLEELFMTISEVKDMQRLPELLGNGSLMVQVNNNAPFAVATSPADPQKLSLWQNLFTPNVKVKSYIPPENDAFKSILSYPVKLVADHIKKIVNSVGSQFPTQMPGTDFYLGNSNFTDIANYRLELYDPGKDSPLQSRVIPIENERILKRIYQVQQFVQFESDMLPRISFAQLCNFHGLYNVKTRNKASTIPLPDFEFHDIIAVLSQYPRLMRRLGLVVDLDIPLSKLPGLTGNIRIIPNGLEFTKATELVCPATAYERTTKGFYTAATSSGSFYGRGFVKINTPEFSVVQLDTDGGALKYISHIDALMLKTHRQRTYAPDSIERANFSQLQTHGNDTQSNGEGLPSHRSAGIAIVKNGMAQYLNDRFRRMNDMKTSVATAATPPAGINNKMTTYVPGQAPLTADDVVIGYRIDVKMTDKPGPPGTQDEWHSLHFQDSEYKIATVNGSGTSILNMGREEGFIQLSTTEDATISEPHMKLSEVIGRWEGWSLAVPLPGKSLNEPVLSPPGKELDTDAEEKDKYTTPNQVPFRLNVMPKIAKGTLPRLRFGQTYAIKMRTVDLAGNSLAHTTEPELPPTATLESSDSVVSGIRYRRYEPVDVPLLIPGEEFRDGESSEVMVIRSSEETTVPVFETNPVNQWTGQQKIFESVCTRHAKPPKTTVGMSITHGMLEKAMGIGATGIKPVYSDIVPKKDPLVTKTNEEPKAKPISSNTSLLEVEYLADPMAAGIAIYLSPADEHTVFTSQKDVFSKMVSFYFDKEIQNMQQANVSFTYEQWMAPKTIRIVLQESNAFNTEWSNTSGERKLLVSVPKGHMLKLNYACFWRPDDLGKSSGILDMMGINDLSDSLIKLILRGQHWMFSPWRTLSFVHAVPRPLTTTGNITILPPAGTTGIPVATLLSASQPDSAAILYDKANPLPRINFIDSDRNYNDDFASINLNVDIHGASTSLLDIHAEWTDLVDDGGQLQSNGMPLQPDGFEKQKVKAKVYHLVTEPRYYNYTFGLPVPPEKEKSPIQKLKDANSKKVKPAPVKHLFNDTKHRMVTYNVIASTRYKEYFFHLLKDDKKKFDITRTGTVPVTTNILSSAPPLPPQVAYVLPIFEWGEAPDPKDPQTLIRGRSAGLRIYLRRPWFSSGEGEKLAVVIKNPASQTGKPLSDETIYTTWGNDPARLSPGAGGIYPTAAVFLSSKINKTGGKFSEQRLMVSDVPGAVADIAAYDVQFDAEKNLYYADIMVFFGIAYFPFIRLALATYQEHSLRKKDGTHCCLSKVVRADYIQIPPTRFTSLKVDATGVEVAISGTAAIPSLVPIGSIGFQSSTEFKNLFEFVIEQLTPKSEDIIISTKNEVFETDEHELAASEINSTNFTFRYMHKFKARPKPYRVKVMEYEVLSTHSIVTLENPRPAKVLRRLVFADTYDVQ